MKAAMLHKMRERLTIEEIPRPQPGVGRGTSEGAGLRH